jgi:outer membrane beta-barrel protein
MKRWSMTLALLASAGALASEVPAAPSLEDQLQMLNLPENQGPAMISTEKLYSIQSRFSPLKGRFELGVGVAQDLTNSAFLSSQQVGGTIRYHMSDRWSIGLAGGQVFNSMTETARLLMQRDGILPDAAYAKYRANLEVGANTFYGKFRLGTDTVLYLDQYVALGGGVVGLNRGPAAMVTLDAGFAFWIGKSGVVRLGMKDHFYCETRELSSSMTHHWLGHIELGWMPGASSSQVVQ